MFEGSTRLLATDSKDFDRLLRESTYSGNLPFLLSMQFLSSSFTFESIRPEEIVAEGIPPMAVISVARRERNDFLDLFQAEPPPPRSYWSRRRLGDFDQWYLELCKATHPDGQPRFFMQLVVCLKHCRFDVYAVGKVGVLYMHSLKHALTKVSVEVCIDESIR